MNIEKLTKQNEIIKNNILEVLEEYNIKYELISSGSGIIDSRAYTTQTSTYIATMDLLDGILNIDFDKVEYIQFVENIVISEHNKDITMHSVPFGIKLK